MYVPDHQRTPSAHVLILSTKAVDHVNNMGNTGMMEPEPAILSPLVCLSKSGTLAHTGHHSQNPPGASLARYNGVEITNSNVNRPNMYLVLNETSVNVQNYCQWNCPIPNSANK